MKPQPIKNTQCCLCQNTTLALVHKDMLECQNCGLFIKEEMSSKESLKKHLAGFLLTACSRPGGTAKRIRKANLQTLDPLERYVSKGALFDVGAASGFIMKAAQDRGWEVHGNDLSHASVKWSKDNYNIEIHHEFFEDIELKSDYFSAVTMWNTLEHTHNPAEVIAIAKRILKPEGVIYIRIPEKGTIKSLRKHYEAYHFYEFNVNILRGYLLSQGFIEREITKNWDGRIGEDPEPVPSTDYLFQLPHAK